MDEEKPALEGLIVDGYELIEIDELERIDIYRKGGERVLYDNEEDRIIIRYGTRRL